MSRTRTLTALGLATACTAVALAAPAGASVPNATGRSSESSDVVAGTWRMTIDPRPNPLGDPPAFPTLITFNVGGTVVEAISSVPGNPALVALGANGASTGLGAWSKKGSVITFSFERFITKDGRFVARQRVEGTTTLSKDRLGQGGPATTTFVGANGAPLGPPVLIDAWGTRVTP